LLIGMFVVLGLGAAGFGLLHVYRLATRPTLEGLGGTVLVYEVDLDRFSDGKLPADYQPEALVAALQRRLDPSESTGIRVRGVGNERVEIGVPRTAKHDEQLDEVKQLVASIGILEFRILANAVDDKEAVEAARHALDPASLPNCATALDQLAAKGLPPPVPRNAEYPWKTPHASGRAAYSWVEVGKVGRQSLGLTGAAADDSARSELWKLAAAARERREPLVVDTLNQAVLFSRKCADQHLSAEDRRAKAVDYFLLTRDPTPASDAITGALLDRAFASVDGGGRPCVGFHLNARGEELFYRMTSQNRPDESSSSFRRHIAIILDDHIESAPSVHSPIRADGIISGAFTQPKVNQYVLVLRAGSLPVALRPQPVSETRVEPK
jgi:preprotein translocase subunit SecD